MTSPAKQLMDKAIALLKEHGVDRWYIIFDDPDNPVTLMRHNGGITWARGAIESELDALQIEWRRRIDGYFDKAEGKEDGIDPIN